MMPRSKQWVAALATALAVAGCSGGGSSGGGGPRTFTISGTISGAPDVAVTLAGVAVRAATTDATGRFAFSGLQPGTYTVTPMSPGGTFSPTSRSVTLSTGDVGGVDFTISRTCNDGWCWRNPLPVGSDLTAVFGTAADDVWAVGARATTLHWDGAAWSLIPGPSAGEELTGVWASGRNDAWASTRGGQLLRWSGHAWTAVWANVSGETPALTAVFGSGPDDVWTVGLGGTLLHWNGATVAKVAGPVAADLLGVWGRSADDVWAVGVEGAIIRFDGNAWSSVASGTTSDLRAVWGSGPNDVWFVGNYVRMHWDGTALSAPEWCPPAQGVFGSGPTDVWMIGGPDMERWGGAEWSSFDDPTIKTLFGVWVASPHDAWAVGDGGAMVRWDGQQWRNASTGPLTDLHSVWGSSADDLWAVGSSHKLLHWDGRGWSEVFAGLPVYNAGLRAVWGTGAKDVWAVGSQYSSAENVVLHFNGSSWSPTPVPDEVRTMDAFLGALWGSAPDDVWAVANARYRGGPAAPFVVHWNGTAWSTVPIPAPVSLHAIWGSGADDVWAVGEAGNVLHYDGASWSEVTVPATGAGDLLAVWGSGPNDVWIAGDEVLRWDGQAWSAVDASLLADLGVIDPDAYPGERGPRAVFGRGPDDVWVVGTGAVLHWDGARYTSSPNPSSYWLNALWGMPTGAMWVVGNGGAILERPL